MRHVSHLQGASQSDDLALGVNREVYGCGQPPQALAAVPESSEHKVLVVATVHEAGHQSRML